jgi:hypothetical protein
MATLMIKDLSVTTELDHSAMASVRGGFNKEMAKGMSLSSLGGEKAGYTAPVNTFTFDASQMIGQSQNVLNNNGNNAAYVCGITSTVNPTQTAHNNISF